MRIIIYCLLSLALLQSLYAAPKKSQAVVFGNALLWNSKSTANNKKIAEHVNRYHEQWSKALDPDCYYCMPLIKAKLPNPAKKRSNKWTKKIESLAEQLNRETGGAFSIHRKQYKRKYRDFGGLAQGYLLENLKRDAKVPFWANFSGDIFYSGKLGNKRVFYLGEPGLAQSPHFKITMNKGWLVSSSFRPKKYRSGKTGKRLKKAEYQQIALVASPSFNGARLDAWSTAIISGGQKTLERLWNLKKYKGQWGFIGLDNKGGPFCSENLKCKFKAPKGQNQVAIRW